MDIHPNPGWDRDELIPRATSTRQDGNLNFPANTHIKYSRRQLFSFKSRAAVPDNLFNLLKTQGILKSRRVRAGRLHKQRIRPISTLLDHGELTAITFQTQTQWDLEICIWV